MKLRSKLLIHSLLLAFSFSLLSPVTAFGYSDDAIDHVNHSQSHDYVTSFQTDCVSACAQTQRTSSSTAPALKETSNNTEDQSVSKPKAIIEKLIVDNLLDTLLLESHIPPPQEIYKLICSYLF